MQRIIQRTKAAEKHVAQRSATKHKKRHAEQRWVNAQRANDHRKSLLNTIKAERAARREDWEAGRLAPRRDVGELKDRYGAVDQSLLMSQEVNWEKRLRAWPIAEGDRVVMVEGRDKGRIGKVTMINYEAETVQVDGLNKVDAYVPEYMRSENNFDQNIQTFTKPVPRTWVKLVYPLRDPETNIPKDVVINELRVEGRNFNPRKGRYMSAARIVPGLNISIPFPKKAAPEHETHDADTHRLTVDEVTERPVLLQPPMPPSVIDELRNKYSIFRKRHDPEYVARKEFEAEDGELRQALLAKTVSTPLQELRELRNRQSEEKSRELSVEQLARIGEVIAAERAKATGAVAKASA